MEDKNEELPAKKQVASSPAESFYTAKFLNGKSGVLLNQIGCRLLAFGFKLGFILLDKIADFIRHIQ
jgi:hypothetical protein